jgi:hypothetical protein
VGNGAWPLPTARFGRVKACCRKSDSNPRLLRFNLSR